MNLKCCDYVRQRFVRQNNKSYRRILQQFMTANNDCKLYNASFTYDKEISFLKSLRPQSHWKPSDEQMECLLSEVTAWTKGCPKQKVLESLYNDLKKLKA